MTALGGLPLAVTVELSDEDVRRVAAAVVVEVTALAPAWLPTRPLTRSEAAEWLQVSTETLRRWERAGVLVPARVDDIVRYAPPQLAAFLTRGGKRTAKERGPVARTDADAGRG